MDTISQDEKERFKQVVYKIRSEHNASTKEIARRAGVHQSTLYRWLDDKRAEYPTTVAIRQLVEAFNIDDGRGSLLPETRHAMRRLEGDTFALFLVADSSHRSHWTIQDRRLELCGLLPGDVAEVDAMVKAETGDVVLLQVKGHEPEPRKLVGPIAVTQTYDPTLEKEPVYWMRDNVQVLGVVVRSVRLHRR